MECLKLSLLGKRDEKFASLCRNDTSSIKRHKERWHKEAESSKCTIVPSNAPEIQSLRKQDSKASRITNTSQEKNTKCGFNSVEEQPSAVSIEIMRRSNTKEDLDLFTQKEECGHSSEPSQPTTSKGKSQATLLAFKKTTEATVPTPSDTSLKDVVCAIEKLSLKVDQFGSQHTTLQQLVFEDDNVRANISVMREAKNIYELTDLSEFVEFFYDEVSGTSVLRCLPCFRLHITAKPNLRRLSAFEAQRLICSSSNGTLGNGLFLDKRTTRQLIEGGNQTWYRQKKSCMDHLCLSGESSKVHKTAMETYQREKEMMKRKASATGNIFRAAITDLKLGAAARNFETMISFLACCGVDVGNIGHGRNKFSEILHCLEKTVNGKINDWLNQPLPSTQLPPHIWATIDKATPARITNQAVLVVGRNESGTPCPIPVDAPAVYKDFEQASYDVLAKLLLEAIENNFSKEVLSRLCGVAADGPYQAGGFRKQLMAILEIAEDGLESLALPVTWDPAHILNLAVVNVKDSETQAGDVFRRFVKRCNVFNSILANGKGFAFLQLVDKSARRPVPFACQRFASSSYDQWLKIENSYASFWKAFDLLNPVRDEEEELQYMIAGYDFVADLLAFLDIMQPVVDLMLRVQSLDTPIWKLKLWWPIVKAKLEKASRGDAAAYPRLEKAGRENIKPGYKYQQVTLLEGWLITKDQGKDALDKRFVWKEREIEEICKDHQSLALELEKSLNRRVLSVTSDSSLSILEVFDAATLVTLHCGVFSEGSVKLIASDGMYESYGVEECKAVLATASKMLHIKQSGMDFDPRLAHRYMSRIKEAIMAGIWTLLCPEWFMLHGADSIPLHPQDSKLVLFESINSDGLDVLFKMKFANGKEFDVRLHEQNVFKSFYANEEIYSIAKPPSCAIIDIVLSKGGPEAIAESYYSAMRAQQQSGGQSNETLARRTKLNWCLPSLKKCEPIIHESVQLYLHGDDELRPHRQRAFFSEKYCVSKVVDRIDSDLGRCPFLSKGNTD
jgi:hypothetical protein